MCEKGVLFHCRREEGYRPTNKVASSFYANIKPEHLYGSDLEDESWLLDLFTGVQIDQTVILKLSQSEWPFTEMFNSSMQATYYADAVLHPVRSLRVIYITRPLMSYLNFLVFGLLQSQQSYS